MMEMVWPYPELSELNNIKSYRMHSSTFLCQCINSNLNYINESVSAYCFTLMSYLMKMSYRQNVIIADSYKYTILN